MQSEDEVRADSQNVHAPLTRRHLLTGGVAAAVGGATGLQPGEARAQAVGSGMVAIDPKAKAKYVKAVDDYYDALFRTQPSVATSFGNHKYDHLIEDGSENSYKDNAEFYRSSLKTLQDLRTVSRATFCMQQKSSRGTRILAPTPQLRTPLSAA
jgi:hypothetical protein